MRLGGQRAQVLNRALDHLEEWLIATLIAAATALIFVAVLHRYGTGAVDRSSPNGRPRTACRCCRRSCTAIYSWLAALDLSWAQELCIYMFIWMAKFGAAYGVRTGIHVGVDVLVNMLPPRSRKQVILFAPAVRRVLHRHDRGVRRLASSADVRDRPAVQRSRSADVDRLSGDPARLRPDVLPLPAGRLVRIYWTGELPHHDEAQVEGVDGDAIRRCIRSGRHAPKAASAEGEPARADPDSGADPDRGGLPCATRPASSCCRRRCAPPSCSRC